MNVIVSSKDEDEKVEECRLTVVGGSVLLGLSHGLLSSSELGRSDDLHRLHTVSNDTMTEKTCTHLGDLLDVFDRLQSDTSALVLYDHI